MRAAPAMADAGPGVWLPPKPGGTGRAAGLALLAHALLIGALSTGLNWRLRPPEAVYAAELWSAVPQVAAPAPVAPPPPPPPPLQPKRTEPVAPPPPKPAAPPARDAQIALEKAERQKRLADEREAEQQRLQKAREEKARLDKVRDDKAREDKARDDKLKAERLKKEQAAQKEAQAEEDRLAKQREANLARIRGLAGASGAPTATGSDLRDAAPSAAYAGRIKARIKPNIVLAVDVPGNPVAEVEVRCGPDGTIIGRKLTKPSGNATWDDTVLRAIDRTEVLPRDVDGRVPSTMTLVFPRRE